MKKSQFKGILILVVNMVKEEQFDTSNDSIIIVDHLENIPGGSTLDLTGWDQTAHPVISAGHPIIYETATKLYKPLGITDGALVALPANHTYAGTLRASILTSRPFASIMVRGTVNVKAFENFTKKLYSLTTGLIIPEAQKSANTLIRFVQDGQ